MIKGNFQLKSDPGQSGSSPGGSGQSGEQVAVKLGLACPELSTGVMLCHFSGGHHPLGLQGGIGPGTAETGGRGRGKDVARPHTASGEQLLCKCHFNHTSQMVTSPTSAQNRAQDAIASILASMNQQSNATSEQGGLVSLAGPVDYSGAGDQVVTMVEASGEVGAQPLNLATIAGGQQIQVQGIKRLSQGTPGGSMVTKKVIIATM